MFSGNRILSWILAVALALPTSCTALVGCNTVPTAMPREFATAAEQIATGITDQGILQKYTANLQGQVIEPGMETYAGVLYLAGAKLKGFSGQVGLAGEGVGNGEGLSPEALQSVLTAGAKYGLTTDQIIQLIEAAQRQPVAPVSSQPAPMTPAQ